MLDEKYSSMDVLQLLDNLTVGGSYNDSDSDEYNYSALSSTPFAAAGQATSDNAPAEHIEPLRLRQSSISVTPVEKHMLETNSCRVSCASTKSKNAQSSCGASKLPSMHKPAYTAANYKSGINTASPYNNSMQRDTKFNNCAAPNHTPAMATLPSNLLTNDNEGDCMYGGFSESESACCLETPRSSLSTEDCNQLCTEYSIAANKRRRITNSRVMNQLKRGSIHLCNSRKSHQLESEHSPAQSGSSDIATRSKVRSASTERSFGKSSDMSREIEENVSHTYPSSRHKRNEGQPIRSKSTHILTSRTKNSDTSSTQNLSRRQKAALRYAQKTDPRLSVENTVQSQSLTDAPVTNLSRPVKRQRVDRFLETGEDIALVRRMMYDDYEPSDSESITSCSSFSSATSFLDAPHCDNSGKQQSITSRSRINCKYSDSVELSRNAGKDYEVYFNEESLQRLPCSVKLAVNGAYEGLARSRQHHQPCVDETRRSSFTAHSHADVAQHEVPAVYRNNLPLEMEADGLTDNCSDSAEDSAAAQQFPCSLSRNLGLDLGSEDVQTAEGDGKQSLSRSFAQCCSIAEERMFSDLF